MIRILWVFLIFLCSCSTDLPDYGKLAKLRILAMQVNTPEVSDTSASVQITPYVSDISGNGRALTYSYQTCIDPGIGYGAQPSCPTAWSTPVTFGPVGTTRKTYTGAAPSLTIQLPNNILASSKQNQVPNYFNGVAYIVVYSLSSQDGSSNVIGFKRILVSTNPSKNINPLISSVSINGNTLSPTPATNPFPTGQVNLGFTLAAGSVETYQSQNSNGVISTETETPIITWFYSDGTTQYDRTYAGSTDQWMVPSPPPVGRASVIVAVVRDGRGGEDIQQFEFE